MAGSSHLPLVVEIAFGAGPMDPDPLTWTDVSAFVRRSQTMSLSRGRDPLSGEPGGRGQLRFSNPDGRFTLGATGAFGLVRNRLPVRVSATVGTATGLPLTYDAAVGWYDMLGATYDDAAVGRVLLWTGLVEKWGQATDAGVRSTVDATLVDRWPRLKQRTLTGDRLRQVHRGLGADHLWDLTDPAGSSRAEDVVAGWDLLPVGGLGLQPWGWGGIANPQGGTTVPVATTTGSGPSHLATNVGTLGWSMTVSCWVKEVSGTVNAIIEGAAGFRSLTLSTSGGGSWSLSSTTDPVVVYLAVGGAAPSLSAGWHHLAATLTMPSGVPTGVLYVDGVQVASGTGSTVSWTTDRVAKVEANGSSGVAYFAVWNRILSAAEIAAIAAAGFDALGQTGQTADVRAGLLASLWTPTSLAVSGDFTATMSKQAVDGVSQADLLLACAQAEDGSVHTGTDGWPLLRAKGARTDAALAATIPAAVLSSDVTWDLDDRDVVNAAQVDRMALGEVASTVNRRNEASIAVYDEVPASVQVWLDSDAQAVARAESMVNMWGDAAPRSRAFTVDLMTCGAAVGADVLMAVDVGSRIAVSGLTSVYPAGTSAGYFVDEIADEITATSWRRTFTVSPALDFLVLDDATFGGLDEWPLG